MHAKDMYIFIGPPGSGKGSLAQLCMQQWGWSKLSTGDLCREHIAQQTEIGKQIDFSIKNGKLITDRLISEMVQAWLKEHYGLMKGLIFDGFPRTASQAEKLEHLLQSDMVSAAKLHVIELDVSDDVVVNRLTSRRICSNAHCQQVYSVCDSSLSPQQKDICDQCSCELCKRSDDDSDVITSRIASYRRSITHVMNYYSGIGRAIKKIQADLPIGEVLNGLKGIIERDSH
jgi:adenylate kinase